MKYLSDAFYLADQKIYGDLNEVSTNLKIIYLNSEIM